MEPHDEAIRRSPPALAVDPGIMLLMGAASTVLYWRFKRSGWL